MECEFIRIHCSMGFPKVVWKSRFHKVHTSDKCTSNWKCQNATILIRCWYYYKVKCLPVVILPLRVWSRTPHQESPYRESALWGVACGCTGRWQDFLQLNEAVQYALTWKTSPVIVLQRRVKSWLCRSEQMEDKLSTFKLDSHSQSRAHNHFKHTLPKWVKVTRLHNVR